MSNILNVKNLSVELGGEEVLSDLTFNIKEKDNLMIVGPNGAGKSVLIHALLGLVKYKGEIKWKKGIKISYIPQGFFPQKEIPLSVEEFFGFKKVNKEYIEKALFSVGLRDPLFLKKQVGLMSKGQFQRVMIAWSLVDGPDVLIFDEPTSGIDLGGEETIYNLLADMEKSINLTIIIVTHDLSVVYKLADNVLCLNKKAVCYGAPQSILSSESLKELYGGDIKVYHHVH